MGNIFVTPTADRVARGVKLNGKVAIVTGAASGIGLETTKTLAKRGATVFMCCRNVQSANLARKHLLDQIGLRFEKNVVVEEMDLASLESVNLFVEKFKTLKLPLDFLILNAAVLGVPFQRTKEGFEMHFGVNFLAHFHLTQQFIPLMSAQENRHCRIIAVCCSHKMISRLKLRNLPYGSKAYDRFKAYEQSKIALSYFAEELSVRLKDSNISSIAADPGSTDTWLFKNLGPIVLSLMAFARIFMNTPRQGAATVIFACLNEKAAIIRRCLCKHAQISKTTRLKRFGSKKIHKELFEMSEELLRTTDLNNYDGEVFSPKVEVWKRISSMLLTLRRPFNQQRKKRPSMQSIQMTSHSTHKKLD